MKNHIVFKFLAIVLCALALLTAVTGAVGICFVAAMDLGESRTVQSLYQQEIHTRLDFVSQNIIGRYASEKLGKCPNRLVNGFYTETEDLLSAYDFRQEEISYQLLDSRGKILYSNGNPAEASSEYRFSYVNAEYYSVVAGPAVAESREDARELLRQTMGTGFEQENVQFTAPPAEGDDDRNIMETEATEPVASEKATDTEDWSDDNYRILGFPTASDQLTYYACRVETTPDYTVVFQLTDSAFTQSQMWAILELAWQHQNTLAVMLGVGLLIFAALAAYLCTAAGRSPGSDGVKPGGLNCLPLDFYACAVFGIIVLFGFLVVEGSEYLVRQRLAVAASVYAYGGYLCCLAFVGLCYAFVAQVKAPGHYWWHHSLCGMCWRLCVKCCRLCVACCVWLWRKLPKVLRDTFLWCCRLCGRLAGVGVILVKWVADLCVRILRWFFRGIFRYFNRVFSLLPTMWQWLLTGATLLLLMLIAVAERLEGLLVLVVLAGIALVLYGSNAFGTLLDATRRMRGGDLEIKVDDRLLAGSFRDFAHELNGLADVAVVAAQKQLKSERMKTELITNVSHDIKTPLTSIINYVDLLQKPHTPEDEKVYLEVLARQSGRMKKLIDDLMEMSKASTGNLPVEITVVNAGEAVNQALGEFADKLAAAQITPVWQQPENTVYICADGRLVWRAMSNLLSNAVKYAQPGTRLYVDMTVVDQKVLISFKNISRDQLNVSADELLERFVRGEASRNTEVSGLGLNIAQSLMELQHGKLELLVDGDLFKVTLIFPKAEAQ